MESPLLQSLLLDWRLALRAASLDGSLARAACEALVLGPVPPRRLEDLLIAWGKDDFEQLPSVEVLSAKALQGAAGAYASQTATIYLQADLLSTARRQQIFAVLNEELGHHLDALLNLSDTAGDEGAVFAELLVGGNTLDPAQVRERNKQEDHGTIQTGDKTLSVEQSAGDPFVFLSLGQPLIASEDGPQTIQYVFRRNGNLNTELNVNFSVGGTAVYNDDYGQRGATNFSRNNGTIRFATGASIALLTIDPSPDALIEGDETITIGIIAGSGYNIGQNSSVSATVRDNDTSTAGTLVALPLPERFYAHSDYERRNSESFAALKVNGKVVGWGGTWGSTAAIEGLSSDVVQIFSNKTAFAALKRDGTVICWGDPEAGGNSSSVSGLNGVVQITSSAAAFTALRADGSIFTWGDPAQIAGAPSQTNQPPIRQIFSTNRAFAALREDGSVSVWGHDRGGGSISSEIQPKLASGVATIFSNASAFAALKQDGSVIAWGDGPAGGIPADKQLLLSTGAIAVRSNNQAFAAIMVDGSVVTWGTAEEGGDSSSVASQLNSGDVSDIFSSHGAFAALMKNGSVVTWGIPQYGGDSRAVTELLRDVVDIVATQFAFAAITRNGSVVTWGYPSHGGSLSEDKKLLLNGGVSRITATESAFAALKADGTVVTWGNNDYGGNSSSVSDQLNGVVRIFASDTAFAALRSNGSVVAWGANASTNAVQNELTLDVISLADSLRDDRLSFPETLPTVTLAVSPASVLEDGADNLVFTFTRTGPTASGLTVYFSANDQSANGATYSVDFNQTGATENPYPQPLSISFAPNSSIATIVIDPTADITVEPDETITLNLLPGSGYTVGTSSPVIGTIRNDDLPIVTLGVSPSSVLEDMASKLLYIFERTGPTTNPLTVNFSVDGSATFGGPNQDYSQSGATSFSARNGTVTFDAGSAFASVLIDPDADITVENDETVVLTLTPGSGYTVGTSSPVIGTILTDDFLPSITLAVDPGSVLENGPANLTYTFSRTGSTTSPLTVSFSVGGSASLSGRAPDYTQSGAATFYPTTGTVTFAAGSGTARVVIDPTSDSVIELDESVVLTLTPGNGYTIGTASPVTGWIRNDDLPTVSLNVSAPVQEDGSANLIYTFSRTGTGATTGSLTVSYSVGGTASFSSPGNDYTQSGATTFSATAGTVTFADGSATTRVVIDPIADQFFEPDETVVFTLTPASNYVLGTTSPVTGTIINDDLPFISLASPGSVLEDRAANLVYTFSRTGPTTSSLTVNFRVGGTASFDGSNPDYTQSGATTFSATAGSITFGAGSATASISIDPSADNRIEPDETVVLSLISGSGYKIGNGLPVTGTISNDDASIQLLSNSLQVREDGRANLDFTFVRSGYTTGETLVYFTLGGSAAFGSDYTVNNAITDPSNINSNGGYVRFRPNSNTAILSLDPTADTDVEYDEFVQVTPVAGSGYELLSTNPGIGRIINDDINGTAGADRLFGTQLDDRILGLAGADLIDGNAGQDTLTGGDGPDIFQFRSTNSFVTAPDRITDFTFNSDRIKILRADGVAITPTRLTRAANNSRDGSLDSVVATAAYGANLTLNTAALVVATHPNVAGTYLLVKTTSGPWNPFDIVVDITGYGGSLPAFGDSNGAGFFA